MAVLKLSDKKQLQFKLHGRTMLSNTSEHDRHVERLREEYKKVVYHEKTTTGSHQEPKTQ